MARTTTPFSFQSTASEVLAGVDLSGKRAIVTGGASGIGLETSRALVNAGAEVTLAVRRPNAVQEMAQGLRAGGRGSVHVAALDLSDLGSVRQFAAKWSGPLHMLVNNAGVMAIPEWEVTAQGWELQLATNFLGHFVLANGLHEALKAAQDARIVSLSSSAQLLGPVVFDDLHFRFRAYEPLAAYAQAKTACVLMAVEATRRWRHQGILANACTRVPLPPICKSTPAGSRRRSSAARRRSKGPLRRCCWRHHRCCKASVAATSRIATRPWSWTSALRTSPGWRPTPSTRPTRIACGKWQAIR